MWCVIPICVTSPPHGGFSSKHSNLPTTLFGIHTANYQAKLSRILRRFFGSWIMNNSIFWKLGISLINWDTGLYHRTILWSIRLSIDNFPGLWYLKHIDPPPRPPRGGTLDHFWELHLAAKYQRSNFSVDESFLQLFNVQWQSGFQNHMAPGFLVIQFFVHQRNCCFSL